MVQVKIEIINPERLCLMTFASEDGGVGRFLFDEKTAVTMIKELVNYVGIINKSNLDGLIAEQRQRILDGINTSDYAEEFAGLTKLSSHRPTPEELEEVFKEEL